MIKDNRPDMHTQTPSYQVPPSTITNTSLLTLADDQTVINNSKWKSDLEHHESTSQNYDIAALCSLFKELLK